MVMIKTYIVLLTAYVIAETSYALLTFIRALPKPTREQVDLKAYSTSLLGAYDLSKFLILHIS